jgi:hypothetical protein
MMLGALVMGATGAIGSTDYSAALLYHRLVGAHKKVMRTGPKM